MGFLTSKLLKLKSDLNRNRLPPEEVKAQAKQAVEASAAVAEAKLTLIEAATAEAAQQQFAKKSKVEAAREAMLLDDADELLADERESVRRYRNKKLFNEDASQSNGGKVSNSRSLILADNITYNDPPPVPEPKPQTPVPQSQHSNVLPWILAAALASGLAGAGLVWLLNRPTTEGKPPASQPPPKTEPTGDGSSFGNTTQLIQAK